MKKITNYFIHAAVFIMAPIVLLSCEDKLNILPRDAQTATDFLKDTLNAERLMNGAYNKMLEFEYYGFPWIGITSITSDDADKGSTPGDAGSDKNFLDNLDFNPSLRSFNDIWKARYGLIYRTNDILYYLPQLSDNKAFTNRLKGEATFLRALAYFDLVRCFGGVPLVLEKIENINNIELVNQVVYQRKTKEEVYAAIEKDLQDAITLLPVSYDVNNIGRATRGAAQGLLAKVFLYQKKYTEAFDATTAVMNLGVYGLLPNYGDVWREVGENSQESLFEVQGLINNPIQGFETQGPRGTPDYGWGFNAPSTALFNAYTADDKRKIETIIWTNDPNRKTLWDGTTISTSWTPAGARFNYKAYQSHTRETFVDNGNTGKNLRVLKYSDILLIRAEAALQKKDTLEALRMVNMTRKRAGLLEFPTNKAITLDEILHERRLEMAMEYDRWFDIVRTGNPQTIMAASGKHFVVGKHDLFPIPEEQITQSGKRLTQNPNY